MAALAHGKLTRAVQELPVPTKLRRPVLLLHPVSLCSTAEYTCLA